MKTITEAKYGQPAIGCYLDQSYRNSASHDAETVRLAVGFGYQLDRETENLLAREDHDLLSDERDDAQMLSECADSAIDWLNEQEARSFVAWYNCGDRGAFGLWPDVDGARDDVGFVSSRKQEFPDDDFRGEWLHVSDHGNATLYVRQDGGHDSSDTYKDEEIWSVV